MRNLYEAARVEEVKTRIAQLRPDSQRQWGKMTAAQALAHCSGAMEMAMGDVRPQGMFLGGIIGRVIKPMVFKDEGPLRKNSPTIKELAITDDRDLGKERERLCGLIDRFVAIGPKGCTTHPHSFFGRLTPDEWSALMYKHLDHHLRQFGV
jgi:hypothetical protein